MVNPIALILGTLLVEAWVGNYTTPKGGELCARFGREPPKRAGVYPK